MQKNLHFERAYTAWMETQIFVCLILNAIINIINIKKFYKYNANYRQI